MHIISFLAGLGFFFTGLHFLSANVQPFFSGNLRTRLIKFTRGPLSSALSGSFLGALTQSTSATTFLCLGLLNANALTFKQVLSLVAWSGCGTALLVFFVSINIKVAGLVSIGIVGLMYLFNLTKDLKSKQFVGIFLAFGLLLFGLSLIKETGYLLNSSAWARDFFIFSSESTLVGLLIGMFVALLVQSSSSVAILALTLHISGLIYFNEAMVLVFGANIGSGLSVLFFSSHLEGQKKQVAIYSFLSKFLGTLLLFPMLWIDFSKVFNFLNSFQVSISSSLMISSVYLILQISGGLIISLFQNKISLLLNYVSPESEAESLFKLHFIYPESAENTETALILASKEQNRIIESLVDFLEPIRIEHEKIVTVDPQKRHELSLSLLNNIKLFISEATSLNKSEKFTEPLFLIQSRNEDILSLVNELASFVENIKASKNFKSGLANSMVESLHLILSLLIDALKSNDFDDELLSDLTSDRSNLMENLRNSLLENTDTPLEERQMLFISTSVFEKIIWIIRGIQTKRLLN